VKGGEILTTIQGVILGIVQGLTEFLPISSSGHLVIFQRLFGLKEGVVTFDIAVHLATLAAVFIVMRKEIWEILKKPFGKLPLLIIAGTIPTIIIGAVFSDFIKNMFNSAKSLGFEFLLTGIALYYADNTKSRNKGINSTTYADAVVIGMAQGVAILPAVSRSGLTIAGAISRGLNREFALKFSFLMSIPAILGAAVKDGYDIISSGSGFANNVETVPLIAGMMAAAISGYIAIRFMLKIFSKASMKIFSYYVFVLAAFVLIDQLFFGKFFGRLF